MKSKTLQVLAGHFYFILDITFQYYLNLLLLRNCKLGPIEPFSRQHMICRCDKNKVRCK